MHGRFGLLENLFLTFSTSYIHVVVSSRDTDIFCMPVATDSCPLATRVLPVLDPHQLVAKAGCLSLAVFIKRPQAEIKSAQALR